MAGEIRDQRWSRARDLLAQANLWEGILLDTLRDFATLTRSVSA